MIDIDIGDVVVLKPARESATYGYKKACKIASLTIDKYDPKIDGVHFIEYPTSWFRRKDILMKLN